jgi:hypothetical protein
MKYHVLVGTHHRTGTAWMHSVFREISEQLAVPYLHLNRIGVSGRNREGRCEALRRFISDASRKVIVFEAHSDFPDLAKVDVHYKTHFRGIHMIRDPRDVAISSAAYHARAAERWLHVPQARFGGLTYQEKNKSFSTLKEKILFESDNSNRNLVSQMVAFDHQEVFRDIKYEDLIEDTKMTAWREVLDYVGFEETEMASVLQAVWAKSLFGGKKQRGAHITSGAKEQWREVFDAALSEEYTRRFGAELAKLGYPLGEAEKLGVSPKLSDHAGAANPNQASLPERD